MTTPADIDPDWIPKVAGEVAEWLARPEMQEWLRLQGFANDGNFDLDPWFDLAGWNVPIGIRRLLRVHRSMFPTLRAIEPPRTPGESDEIRHLR